MNIETAGSGDRDRLFGFIADLAEDSAQDASAQAHTSDAEQLWQFCMDPFAKKGRYYEQYKHIGQAGDQAAEKALTPDRSSCYEAAEGTGEDVDQCDGSPDLSFL